MVADVMLRWMSETGAGQLDVLRNQVRWIARTADLPAGRAAAGRWLRDVSALGHAEIDWEQGRWAVTGPAVARLPAADGMAVLAGSRRYGLVQALEAGDVAVHYVTPDRRSWDIPVPVCLLVQFDTVAGLREAAAQAGAAYAGCAAERLAQVLPGPALGAVTAPPAAGNTTLERVTTSGAGVQFEPAQRGDEDGLYRARLQGRRRGLYRENGTWYWCELAAGIFTDLGRRGISVIRWRPEDSAGRGGVGTAFVDWGAPLPILHARALVLCSGLPPQFHPAARTAAYSNVPLPVIEAVAASLHQRLQVAQ